jgi:hypothetical protein
MREGKGRHGMTVMNARERGRRRVYMSFGALGKQTPFRVRKSSLAGEDSIVDSSAASIPRSTTPIIFTTPTHLQS